MDEQRARSLIYSERERIEALLVETRAAAVGDRSSENEPGDFGDSAQPLTAEGTDDAVTASLRQRLEALERAGRRLDEGTYGLSVRSGRAIPDERLEADPAAELTIEEVSQR